MHVIAGGGGACLTATDIMTMLEALSVNEARIAFGGDDFPDLGPLFRAVPGLDRAWRDAPESVRTPFAVGLVAAGVMPVSELGDGIVEQGVAWGLLAFSIVALTVISGCTVEDVCSARSEEACIAAPKDLCRWEAGTAICLQRCPDGGACPEGLECHEDSGINHCDLTNADGCTAEGLLDDVCRPEED